MVEKTTVSDGNQPILRFHVEFVDVGQYLSKCSSPDRLSSYSVLNQVSTKYCNYSDSGIRESKANEIRVQVYIVQYVRARVCLRAQACVCTRVCRPLLRRKSLAVATL